MIRFLCPNGHRLVVPPERAGKKGRCPVCQQRVFVPESAPQPSGKAKKRPAAPLGEAPPSDERGTSALALDSEATFQSASEAAAAVTSPDSTESGTLDSPPVAKVVSPPKSGASPPPLPEGEDSGETLIALDGDVALEGRPDNTSASSILRPAAETSLVGSEEPGPAAHRERNRVSADKQQTVYMLSLALTSLAVFGAAPAVKDLNLATAPGWAWVVILVAAFQIVYIGWMLSLPDWSTVWIGMIVFAVSASVYGMGWAVLALTPAERDIDLLGLDEVDRGQAAGWCAAVSLLTLLLTYACGRVSWRWRRSWEMDRAQREAAGVSHDGAV